LECAVVDIDGEYNFNRGTDGLNCIVVQLLTPPYPRDSKSLWFKHNGKNLMVSKQDWKRIGKFINDFPMHNSHVATEVDDVSKNTIRIIMRRGEI